MERLSGERYEVEREIGSAEYLPLLHRLQEEYPFYRDFAAWSEVVAFMREGSSRDPRKDHILCPIFRAMAEEGDGRWQTVLLVIFRPGLDSIFDRMEGHDPNEDDRWENILWSFMKAVWSVDLAKRSSGLVQKVINCTIRRFRNEYRRARLNADRENPTDPDMLKDLDTRTSEGEPDLQAACEAEVERLRIYRDASHISEPDFHLLVSTRVYGKSVAEHARDVGMSYALARKRRLRAEAAIRKAEQ